MSNLIFNIKKINLVKKIKLNFSQKLLKSKDMKIYNKYFLFKIKKSNLYKKYISKLNLNKNRFLLSLKARKILIKKKKERKKSPFLKLKESAMKTKKSKYNNVKKKPYKRKLFKNKSFENIKLNFFFFQNNYHQFKKNKLGIF